MQRKSRIMLRLLLSILTLVFAMVLVILIYLLIVSKGQVEPFTDKNGSIVPGSIAEKIKVEINGTEQGMFLRGKDSKNPVLLFIHGGPGVPGVPEYFLNETYRTELEEHFTVCWWETRGSGLSYQKDLDASSITTKQLIEDTVSVTEYLSNRFGKDKIYLMGHSAGTLIGIQVAMEHPDLYYAYIGMSQITGNGLSGGLSNTLTYHYMVDIFTARSDDKSLKELERYSIKQMDGTIRFDLNYLSQLDDLKHKAGCGTMHNMNSVITGIFLPQMNSRCYTLSEKINYWRGKAFMPSTAAYEEMLTTNLLEESLKVQIPIYFFSGIYDYTCPYPLSLTYFNLLEAPLKGFYTFENSAHSPLWEEPERAIEILVQDVLKGTNQLADEQTSAAN